MNLTEEQKLLVQTPDYDLKLKFPQYTRDEARSLKNKLKNGILGKDIPSTKERGMNLKQKVSLDRENSRDKLKYSDTEKKYKVALSNITALERDLEKALTLKKAGVETHVIKPKVSSGASEATSIWVASDWHIEETVDPNTVSGLNEFNLSIAKRRVETFFRAGLRLTDILAKDVGIKTIVLALLGDFITNDIHEEFLEITETQPILAAKIAQDLLASGIQFVLDNSTYELVIPCHSGNHARTTKTTRFSTENGHSLEYLIYIYLAQYFSKEPRVTFLIADGYHSYMDVYGMTVRFHHGHAIKYGGGVGGIFIPAFKAIAQWNKGRRADLDVFGHFHQSKDGGNFICNGSLIGYNAFALSIKADFETPRQTLFLIDRDRGKTGVWPIIVDKPK